MKQVYSLIAQRDNAVNMQIAEASRRIAEASRQDNLAMREIAEDSKAVALATARDSAAMRVIAAVTILFLPATFTAVSYFILIPIPLLSPLKMNNRHYSAPVSSTSTLATLQKSYRLGSGYTVWSQLC